MKAITYPINFFDRPFADAGNKQVIPETTGTAGRASLTNGFPTETQLPLAQGGIAPNRLDFNGALYMLSALAFWQQSGGQMKWTSTLNYDVPCIVFYNNKLWWCLQANGPNMSSGVRTPGTEPDFWEELIKALQAMSGEDDNTNVLGNPVGTVIHTYDLTFETPEGYLPCDGSSFSATTYPKLYAKLGNKTVTPDMRGLFVRCYDPNGLVEPGGDTRAFGTVQGDAIREITGGGIIGDGEAGVTPGAYTNPWGAMAWDWRGSGRKGSIAHDSTSPPEYNEYMGEFRASLMVPTAQENRPKNINLLYFIKHD